MSSQEVIERLCDLVQMQNDIIKQQAAAIAQLGAVTSADALIEEAERRRAAVIGD